jgi:AbiTii
MPLATWRVAPALRSLIVEMYLRAPDLHGDNLINRLREMNLLDEIINLSADNKESISVLLRKCMILAYTLNNETFKIWIDKELNGYDFTDELPKYRTLSTISKGFFVGIGGSQIDDQPLTLAVMKPEDWAKVATAKLVQPIVAYESIFQDNRQAGPPRIIEWSPDLTVKYQESFCEHYTLIRAWKVIPATVLPALVDTVRSRVLRFALELRDDMGLDSDNIATVSQETVDKHIVSYIFGGVNIISGTARDFTQIGAVAVEKGDISALVTALRHIGVSDSDVAELTAALRDDAVTAVNETGPTLGQRTMVWLKGLGGRLASAGTQIAGDTAKAEAMKLISQYLGLS